MDDTSKATLEAYEHGVDQYVAAMIPNVTGSLKEWIDAGLALLPAGAHILELGTGHGRDATYMEGRGFVVDRTDAARAFIEYLKQQGKDVRLLNALTDDFGGPYDMVYASAVLIHFTPEQTDKVLKKAHEALKPEGLLSFSVKVGDGAGWSESKISAPRFFTYWREEPLRRLLADAHFKVVFWEDGQRGRTGNQPWYHIIARRLEP